MSCTEIRSTRRRLLLGRRGDRLGDIQRADFGRELARVEASAGSCPVLGGELQVPVPGPVGQDAKDVAEVLLGIEAVQAGRGDQRQEIAGAGGMIVAADEEPGLAPHRDLPQLPLRRIIVWSESAVVEKARERVLLADDVAKGSPQKASLAPHALVPGPRPT